MPKLLETYKDALMDKGYAESSAYAIATAKLQEQGLMKGGKLTAKGKIKQKKY